jgi:hypothetical protein
MTNHLTYHFDNERTGWNPNEDILTITNVKSSRFKKLVQHVVDGDVYAQPLYVENLHVIVDGIDKGTHNIVFVATENNSVYAFDADSQVPNIWLWKISLNLQGQEAAKQQNLPGQCINIKPVVGITSTPVIDINTKIMYIVAKTEDIQNPMSMKNTLHAIQIDTGRLVKSVNITGTYNGINFDARMHFNRPGLLLYNDTVYIAFACHCDQKPYYGWIFAYKTGQPNSGTFLNQVALLNINPTPANAPNQEDLGGGIWMSGFGLACDNEGYIYCSTGNGKFDGIPASSVIPTHISDSIIKLGSNLVVKDFFTPFNQQDFEAHDLDVAAGGVMLLPTQQGSIPNMLICCGKFPTVYLINRDEMGKYQTGPNNSDRSIQSLPHVIGNQSSGIWGGPAYYTTQDRQFIYYAGNQDYLKAFELKNGKISLPPASQSSDKFGGFRDSGGEGGGGSIPCVSSSLSAQNGIIWTLDRAEIDYQHPVPKPINLYAYDATDLTNGLGKWEAGMWSNPDGSLYTTPTIINGKVYVGSSGLITVFGLS